MAGIDEETKRRLKRRLRRRQKNALILGQQADQQIENLLIRRFDRLMSVRRFVTLWTTLLLILIFSGIYQAKSLSVYYQSLQPVPGGLYTEGLVGSFTNANPMYASGAADTAVSRLVFSGLFKYDTKNNLVGDLAQDYRLNDALNRYTVHLKQNVKWTDGYPFTADDVVYTYKTIQNIEAQSPLYSSWQGINVTKLDDYTVNFDLPNALSSFPYSLTNGIVPQHLLKKIPAEQLRSAPFNTTPIGTGPFIWKFIEVTGNTPEVRQQRISLAANKHYFEGRPKLDGINLITFNSEQEMVKSFEAKQITAMSGLENVPDPINKDKDAQIYTTPLTTEVDTFFNNSHGPALSDAAVRKALVLSVDRGKLATLFDEPVLLADSPLLHGQLGYDKSLAEPAYDEAAANQTLDQDGWARGAGGVRAKGGQILSFNLSAQDSPNYAKVAQFLQEAWSKVGFRVQVSYFSQDELQGSIIANHDYDALLYGVSVGVDPDVYAYWDSSQAAITSQGHLNLSEYKSAAADQSVEAGRTRSDPQIRAVKYKAFLTQWDKDLPALVLYQPNYLYISRGPVFNYERQADNSAADRFYNASDWMIRQKRQTNN
jgi:peptide/nickel transport system substrate-binding protein